MQSIIHSLQYQNLSEDVIGEVVEYYKYEWKSKRGINEAKASVFLYFECILQTSFYILGERKLVEESIRIASV